MAQIGEKLRTLRKQNQLTLKDLSQKTGLSVSFISQVETDKSSVTLESLMKLAEALDVKPSHFFPSETATTYKKNIAVQKQLGQPSNRIDFTYRDLSGGFDGQLFTPTLIELEPRKEGVTPIPHTGQEFIYVLEGTLTIVLDDDTVHLHPGESIHMKSTVPHNWLNLTEQVIKFLLVSA